MDRPLSSKPTPVTVLAGFLGSGKTTLLNRILESHHGLRITVMINDFGELNIDAQLVTAVEDDYTFSLENGCICCNIRDDLLTQTLDLIRRPNPPEYIIVEASGVSDPIAIAETFTFTELSPFLVLDSIITLVDAEQFGKLTGDYQRLAHQQVAVADIVVINKTDLVSAEQLAELKQHLQTIQPRIFETTHGQLPLELLIGVAHHPVDALLERDDYHHHEHAALFDSWQWSSASPLSGKILHRALRNLPPGILRAKGILFLKETPQNRMILQVVGSRLSLTPGDPWRSAAPYSQIVAISMTDSVDFGDLTAMFDRAVTNP